MQQNKPSIPQGTRDFNAATIYKRQYIINTIKAVFELYGFEPLETPAFENLTTLMGKYGEEGDKLIFKILNNGLADKAEVAKEAFSQVLNGKNTAQLTERALKYDLTIPFARYVAMQANMLTMPYKRYQIQPVWRADKPQKGRYREFMQCDADIVGSTSIINEVDLVNIYATVFEKLQLQVVIKINNRKILTALAQICQAEENLITITTAIDKLDKIGLQKVVEELAQKGISQEAITKIEEYLNIEGTNSQRLLALKTLFVGNALAAEGLEEIETLITLAEVNSSFAQLQLEPTLARGLNYYTGIIFEVAASNFVMGSIGGGGRYNNLTDLFGVKNIAGVGISFGLDRIYDVLEGLNLFTNQVQNIGPTVMVLNLNAQAQTKAYKLTKILRNMGVAAEMYYENTKIDKQYKYAEKRAIPYVINVELANEPDFCTVKNINTGLQTKVNLNQINNFNFN
jgi:histidyl-tRNA synthetase